MRKQWPPDWWHHVSNFGFRPPAPCSAGRAGIVDFGLSIRNLRVELCVIPIRKPENRLRLIGRGRRARFFLAAVMTVLAVGSVTCAAAVSPDAVEQGKDEKIEPGSVTGELVMVKPTVISVEYSRKAHESNEMLLPLGNHTRFEYVKDLSELKRGDTVTVHYDRAYRDGPKAGERTLVKTVATTITLVKHASGTKLNSGAALPQNE